MKRLLLVISLIAGSTFYIAAQCSEECEGERSQVKTLSDSKAKLIRLRPKRRSISWLRTREEPAYKPDARLVGLETMAWRVRGVIVGHVSEPDMDLAVVLAQREDLTKTITIEFPGPQCTEVCHSRYRARIKRARTDYIARVGRPPTAYKELKQRIFVEVVGIGFWDTAHSFPQPGTAPNNLELHPVLSFRVISSPLLRGRR
jgi:hypothetical protein